MTTAYDPFDHDEFSEWITCWNCGGDGYIDMYDTDPNWYDGVESEEPCDICDGEGGWPRPSKEKNEI